ncbi:GL23547 [Drosophila persimilis]|uniref:GL23547 n=1 Tax=Drosophila persimilis TaxID=7234 RepID=B4G2T9_DROPE|nr:GL23547 [Drosophila persimilis]
MSANRPRNLICPRKLVNFCVESNFSSVNLADAESEPPESGGTGNGIAIQTCYHFVAASLFHHETETLHILGLEYSSKLPQKFAMNLFSRLKRLGGAACKNSATLPVTGLYTP